MAFCPECQSEMDTTDILCKYCGYDFPIKAKFSKPTIFSLWEMIPVFSLSLSIFATSISLIYFSLIISISFWDAIWVNRYGYWSNLAYYSFLLPFNVFMHVAHISVFYHVLTNWKKESE